MSAEFQMKDVCLRRPLKYHKNSNKFLSYLFLVRELQNFAQNGNEKWKELLCSLGQNTTSLCDIFLTADWLELEEYIFVLPQKFTQTNPTP